MAFKFNSLRSRLLFSFLALTLITVFVVGISVFFFERQGNLTKISNQINQVLKLSNQLTLYEQGFLMKETINDTFYQTTESSYLAQHSDTLEQLGEAVRTLASMNGVSSLDIEESTVKRETIKIRAALDSYSAGFNELVRLSLARGFKDYGLVGRMRDKAHEIEEMRVGITTSEYLMLRRHEKDYIIRKDPKYSKRFLDLSETLINKLASEPGSPENKIRELLIGYRRDFQEMVQLETKMGVNRLPRENGQAPALDIMENSLEKSNGLVKNLYTQISSEVEKSRTSQATLFIILTILAVILSILLGYLVSARVTKPIVKLTRLINQTVESNFDTDSGFVDINTRDEIGKLTEDFNTMLAELQRRLKEINEKTKALENQNEELQRLNSDLENSQKELEKLNSVKDKFFSIISHDLRSPLNNMKGFLTLMEMDADEFTPEMMRKFSRDTQKSINRLIEMLENLLRWSLFQTGDLDYKPEKLNLAKLIEDNIDLYGGQAGNKGIMLAYDVPPDAMVVADKNMMAFILRNLTTNAIKFSNSNTTIATNARAIGNYFEVSVIDQGVGMTPAQVDKIFKADVHFSTAGTSKEKGTGFGLTLCIDFIRKNKGEIRIESEPGKGTAVIFTVPKVLEVEPA